MPNADPVDLVVQFIDRVNSHDVRGLCALMTDDHLFVDSLGESIRGKDEMFRAWTTYFYLFPDFSIQFAHLFRRESEVAIFGTARGTYAVERTLPKENGWSMPAAWRAVVRDGQIAEWHVYADNEPVRRLLGGTVPGTTR